MKRSLRIFVIVFISLIKDKWKAMVFDSGSTVLQSYTLSKDQGEVGGETYLT